MRFETPNCPQCDEVTDGTVETLQGRADLMQHADGTFEYEGNTEIWWDEQKTNHDKAGISTNSTSKERKQVPEKPYVVIRTYSAGVHIGTLESREGKEVKLSNARRIWYWKGANTLSEISLHGVSDQSRISEAVPEITLTEAIEIIPCSAEAQQKLDRSIWAR